MIRFGAPLCFCLASHFLFIYRNSTTWFVHSRLPHPTARPQHYKHFGFAGRGAKTAFAHRDGLSNKLRDKMIGTRASDAHPTVALSKEARRAAESVSRSCVADIVSGERVLRGKSPAKAAGKEATLGLGLGSGAAAADPGVSAASTASDLDKWRRVQVTTHVAPQRYEGTRPYTTNYSHYKYMGYAGQGAKTSWACNPKLVQLNVLEK